MNPKKEITALSGETLLLKEWEKRLGETGVPLDEWGKGEAKTLNHLVKEIYREAINIFFDEERGKWMREAEPVEVHVFYESPEGVTYFLREDRQIFKDGRERRRDHPWIAEKMEKGEDSLSASIRGVWEEVGLVPPFASGPNFTGNKEIERESCSYPGIISKHSVSCFEVFLTPEQFESEGYVEEQEDKTTFFVWEEMMEDMEGK